MDKRLTMVYWKGDKFWLGKLLEHPEIMTQGDTLEELEENLRDAYVMMACDIYINPARGKKQPVARHHEIDDMPARHIERHLGIKG